jgi:hypothetical protein
MREAQRQAESDAIPFLFCFQACQPFLFDAVIGAFFRVHLPAKAVLRAILMHQ